MKKKYLLVSIVIAAGILLASCAGGAGSTAGKLTASGTISAKSVNISPEIGGKVDQINVNEGDTIQSGDVLFTVDREYIQAQMDQAQAAKDSADAALSAAQEQLNSAQLQQEIAVQGSRLQNADQLANELHRSQPGAFDLPVWYFTRDEEIQTAQTAVDNAKANLDDAKQSLDQALTDIVNSDFVALEKELAAAQEDYYNADAALTAVTHASDNTEMKNLAQDQFDLAETTLENVQKRYEQALNDNTSDDVLNARAEVGVAQATYDQAVNHLMSFYIGDNSLQVQAAQAGVDLAQKNVAQAEAGQKQAQANIDALQIQMNKTSVTSPISGTVLSQNLEKGELVGAGSVVMTVGNFDQVNLTVYVPEDKYGLVSLGQKVNVTVDSFPGVTFTGKVVFIADKAEFTPSNVQTAEGRKSTVFAVKINIDNQDNELLPGMPADVDFILN